MYVTLKFPISYILDIEVDGERLNMCSKQVIHWLYVVLPNLRAHV